MVSVKLIVVWVYNGRSGGVQFRWKFANLKVLNAISSFLFVSSFFFILRKRKASLCMSL